MNIQPQPSTRAGNPYLLEYYTRLDKSTSAGNRQHNRRILHHLIFSDRCAGSVDMAGKERWYRRLGSGLCTSFEQQPPPVTVALEFTATAVTRDYQGGPLSNVSSTTRTMPANLLVAWP